MILLSILWFAFLGLCCFRWYREDGVSFFFDVNRIAVLIWSFGMALYDLELSSLLHPDLLMNIVGIVIVAIFVGFERFNTRDQVLLGECFNDLTLPNNIYYWVMFGVLVLACLCAFAVNVASGNIRGLSDNPGKTIEFSFGYIYRLSVPIALACYMSARLLRRWPSKLLMLASFIIFSLIAAASLDRGPIVWLLTGIAVYELFSYSQRIGKLTLSVRSAVLIVVLFVIIVWAFDAFGSTRVTSQGITSVSDHYRMNIDIPDGFTWVYIYITTPLENARFALEEINVGDLTFGGKLFYPLIKFIANLIGLGDAYSGWIQARTSVYAYLKPVAGLTVGTFLLDALQDFSYFGVVLYPLMYGVMTTLFKTMLRTRWLSSFTKVIAYSLVFQETLWSIFDNTVLFGPVLVCVAFFVAIDFVAMHIVSKRTVCKQ